MQAIFWTAVEVAHKAQQIYENDIRQQVECSEKLCNCNGSNSR